MKIFIKFSEEDDAKASFLLARTGRILCLSGDVYLCESEQLRVLDEQGIFYKVLSADFSEKIVPDKAMAL